MIKPRVTRAPLRVEWELTFQCNQKCLFCFNADQTPHDELDFRNIKTIIDKLEENCIFSIVLSGGEPFLHPDIDSIIKYLSQKKFRVTILTNGTLISESFIRFIADYKSRFSLQFSIEGMRDTHDTLVGRKGAFDTVMEKIDILKKYKIRNYPATTLTSLNYREIPALHNLFLKKHFKTWRVVTLVPFGAALTNNLGLSLSEYKWVYTHLAVLNKSFKINIEIRCPSGLPLTDNFFSRKDERVQWVGCCGSILYFQITPNGDVYPCCLLKDAQFLAGNLVHMPLEEIWQSPAMDFLRDNFNNLTGKCVLCRYNHVCRGGCKALSQKIHGDYTMPDPRCLYEPSTGLTLCEFFLGESKEVII